MKKIISLVVFVIALIWTWCLFTGAPAAVAFETHADIQGKMAEMIKEIIITKKPSASEVQVTRIWTESLGDNKVRAVFSYKFNDKLESGEVTEQNIEGEAILHREASTFQEEDRWVIQSVKTLNDVVSFSEGDVISPNMELPAEVTPENSTETGTVTAPTTTPATTPGATPTTHSESH